MLGHSSQLYLHVRVKGCALHDTKQRICSFCSKAAGSSWQNLHHFYSALRRFVWVFSPSLGLIKAGRKSNRRRGNAEVRGGKCSFSSASIFPSSDLRASASPVRCFLFWLSNEIEPTRNAAAPKICHNCLLQNKICRIRTMLVLCRAVNFATKPETESIGLAMFAR